MLIYTCQKEKYNMTIKNLTDTLTNIKKGPFKHIQYRGGENGYEKTTTMIVRFINYYHMKSFLESGKTPKAPNPNETTIIPHILTYNKNTNKYYVHVYPTKHHKAHSTYTFNGKEITKEEYYQGMKKKPSKPSPVFTISAENVIAIW